MEKRESRLLRLIQLITEIKTNPRQRPEQLCRSLKVSRAMFFEDKRALEGLGFAFAYDRGKRKYRIVKDTFLPTLNLTTSELISLIMAVRQLSSTGDYTLTYNGIEAVKKIVSNTPPEVRGFFQASIDEAVLQEGFGCRPEILNDLWRACQEHHRVVITYAAPRVEIQEHEVDPYQILFKRRALYLDGYDVEEKGVRMFRINRIGRVAFLGVRLPDPIVNYDFRERHRHSFSVFVGGEPRRVRVRFDAHTAPYIQETLWHSSQHTESLPDGGLLLEVTVSNPKEVAWWAMQWGAGAEVLEPPELRAYVAETVKAMARMYEGEEN